MWITIVPDATTFEELMQTFCACVYGQIALQSNHGKRSRLMNEFPKYKTKDIKDAYKKQRNYCISLPRFTKKVFS